MKIKLVDGKENRVGELLDIIPISKKEYLFVISDIEKEKIINLPIRIGETYYQDKLIESFYPEAFMY